MKLLCPTCGDDGLDKMLQRAKELTPGWALPCPNCLELATVTPQLTLRKTTARERLAIMSNPEGRALMETFAAKAKEFRSVRDELERHNKRL